MNKYENAFYGLNKTKTYELNTILNRIDDSDITNKITRSATIVIAASDSSAKSKAQADYVCDGTNDNVDIQTAIDELPTSGGKIQLLEGTFLLDAPNDFYVNGSKYAIDVRGTNIDFAGCIGTILKLKDGINVADGVEASDLATLVVTGSNINIHDLRFNNNKQNITAYYNIAIWTGHNITNEHTNNRVNIYNNYTENTNRWAIWGDGGGPFWNVHHNMIVPGSGGGIVCHNGPEKSIISNNIIGNDTANCNTGIFIDSVDNVLVTGNYIHRPAADGIYAYDAVNDCVISNNIIENYYGTTNAIRIMTKEEEASVCEHNLITGNSFVNIPTGINITDAFVKNTTITNNQFVNVTTPLVNFGTTTILENNIGCLNKNTGTATVVAGNTTISVPHGLYGIPRVVMITTATTPTDKNYCISSKGGTTFTIAIDSAAESNITFYWSAAV